MKFLFLYTELSQYFIACINELQGRGGHEVHVVRWAVNPEAPFDFAFQDGVKVHDRDKLDRRGLLDLAEKIGPDLIYSSGWMDKKYLAVCRAFRGKIPVVVGFDNKWTGTVKQHIAALLKELTITKYFSHCWIPGHPQREFAKKMGFDAAHTLEGFYSCDFELFSAMKARFGEEKRKKFPHKFVFVGRYNESKGVKDLWRAFTRVLAETSTDWELWCVGTGDVRPPEEHPRIKHLGFIQPKDIHRVIAETGVFILPSTFEPWGVAVHEFAAAGFPLICSDEVGAASAFLEEGRNGYAFKASSIPGLKAVMKQIMALSDERLYEMGERSAQIASHITPKTWTNTLLAVVKK